eukprot:gene15101-biopygen17150
MGGRALAALGCVLRKIDGMGGRAKGRAPPSSSCLGSAGGQFGVVRQAPDRQVFPAPHHHGASYAPHPCHSIPVSLVYFGLTWPESVQVTREVSKRASLQSERASAHGTRVDEPARSGFAWLKPDPRRSTWGDYVPWREMEFWAMSSGRNGHARVRSASASLNPIVRSASGPRPLQFPPGNAQDNPAHPETLTTDQARKSVSFQYSWGRPRVSFLAIASGPTVPTPCVFETGSFETLAKFVILPKAPIWDTFA